MAITEKANKAVEQLAKTTGDSYRVALDHTVSLQERNAKLLQNVLDDTAQEVRSQTEINRAVAQELLERAGKQRDAFHKLAKESMNGYMDLAYAPLTFYKQSLRLVESDVPENGFPISNYDELNVAEVSQQIDGLTAEQIIQIREYEKQHKNRDSLIEQLDRKLKPAS